MKEENLFIFKDLGRGVLVGCFMSTSKWVQAGDHNVIRRLFVWVETDLIRLPLEFPL